MNRTPPNNRPRTDAEMEAFGLETETAPVVPAAPATRRKVAEEKTSIPFHYKMTPSSHKRLAELAKAEDRSMQWVLNKIVTEGLERRKKGGAK